MANRNSAVKGWSRWRSPRAVIALCGVAVVIGGIVSGVGIANAEPGPGATADQLLKPAVSEDNSMFYTDAQIDAAWDAVAAHYPRPLAPGYAFPKTAPGLFHPGDGKNHVFESGLVDQVAAQYWRCTWLDAALTKDNAKTGSATSGMKTALGNFHSLPGITKEEDSRYSGDVSNYAKERGVGTTTADYQLDGCEGLLH